MKFAKKYILIISFILTISMFFSFGVVPSYAVTISDFLDGAQSFGNWLLDNASEQDLGYLLNKAVEMLQEDEIEPADHWHNWERYGFGGIGSDGARVANFRCTICGQTITADPDTIRTAYNSYVDDLPATCYTSEGRLIWKPVVADVIVDISTVNGNMPFSTALNGGNDSRVFSLLSGGNGFHVRYVSLNSSCLFGFNLCFKPPLDGSYKRLDSCMYTGSFVLESGSVRAVYADYSHSNFSHYTTSSTSFYATIPFLDFEPQSVRNSAYGSFDWYFPIYEIIPDSLVDNVSGGVYNINTRVTNITGDVAYYDIDGNLQLAPSVNIVNEGAKTYYNPVTNTTQQVTNWTYDYSDRSYKLELNTGDTTTVTYGDEYIRIQEGDTVYNVYYVTNNTTPPLTHTHEWYQTGATQPTCTEYGQKVYT